MAALDLKKMDAVFVVTMSDEENANTFTADVLKDHHRILDEIERSTENAAVVLTSGHPKSWCTGINLAWLQSRPEDDIAFFLESLEATLLRWALLDLPTVGCITGHTFAGGAILASGLDFRLMREDRGWFCFSEVDVKLPFTALMHRIVELLPNRQALRDLLLTGKRIGGGEAVRLAVVDGAYPEHRLFDEAMALARMLSTKDRRTYAQIKRGMRYELTACAGESRATAADP